MENENQKKPMGCGTKILVALGVIFLVLLLIGWLASDDEEETEEVRPRQEADVVDQEPDSGKAYANIESVSVGTDAKSATIMVYMNGSDLETQSGEATGDIAEMLKSGVGKNVNVVIQTMGTKKWQYYGISGKTSQTYIIKNKKLKLVRDDLGQLDCTEKSTLSEFISFCKKKYPAERYILQFWDHGGGPVYGFGYDEWAAEDASLTIAEIAAALKENDDIHFDMIGMDCCIMASMETCYALAPYAKYALLSEDFESGLGWSYTRWMKKLEKNPGISTPLLGKYIVDDIIKDNENEEYGDSACMGLFNLSTSKSVYNAWKAYAYKNEDALLNKNYSKKHRARGRGFFDYFWGADDSNVTLEDYYISDILALVESVDDDSDEAKSLISALKAAVAYYGHTSDKNELTGLAVSLPYGDSEFYKQLKSVYKDIGLDSEYIKWLKQFVNSRGNNDYYNYDSFEDSWGGWAEYEDDYGCNLSGGSCEYAYDYDDADYYGYEDDYSCGDDWIYDSKEDIWYCYQDDYLYLYDEGSDTTFYYDDRTDETYYYDDAAGDWCLAQ
ncbi:MAG: hypothetical protein K6B14_10490 [Lachnospiraceae bacterium]|nr:hypothetical protein [Lachnospiraceae bacterium]